MRVQAEWIEHARAWVAKAESDLATARILIHGDEKHYDTGAYHCQQAAEKILKAWLTANGRIFSKTHDLDALLDDCAADLREFERFRLQAEALTPLASEFRYPGEMLEPNADEAGKAFSMAAEIVAFGRQGIDKLARNVS